MAYNPKTLENLKPFSKDDPRIMKGGNTGHRGYRSVKRIMEELTGLSPEEFFEQLGTEIPKRYRKNKQMMEAVISNNIALALSNGKGTTKAMEMIYDRVDGKPKQTIEIKTDITEDDLENMTDEELEKLKKQELE